MKLQMTITVDLEQAQQVINLLKPPVGTLNPEIETALPAPDDIVGAPAPVEPDVTTENPAADIPQTPETEPAAENPTTGSIPIPTIEEVRAILAPLSKAGKPVARLLQDFGVTKLSQVPPEKYPDLLKKAEGL